MRSMPRVYRNFEELESAELNCLDGEVSIDQMLDEMFADELDIDFSSKQAPTPESFDIELEL